MAQYDLDEDGTIDFALFLEMLDISKADNTDEEEEADEQAEEKE